MDMGTLAAPEPCCALLGIFVTAVLVMKKVPGALMLGMAFTVVLGIPLGVTALPQTLTAAPELSLAALKPDFTGLLCWGPYLWFPHCSPCWSPSILTPWEPFWVWRATPS